MLVLLLLGAALASPLQADSCFTCVYPCTCITGRLSQLSMPEPPQHQAEGTCTSDLSCLSLAHALVPALSYCTCVQVCRGGKDEQH